MRKTIRAVSRFLIPLLAGAAFVFGAVRYWDIETDRVIEMARVAVVLVLAMAALALVSVVLIKGGQAIARRGRQKKR